MIEGFPGGSVVKNPPANAGDEGQMGSIPGSGRSPGGEDSNLLQYSCLENPMDRGQIAEERREVKGKGEKERYTHLNAKFQRIARRDKAFLSDQRKK